jgi:hypothetical protein
MSAKCHEETFLLTLCGTLYLNGTSLGVVAAAIGKVNGKVGRARVVGVEARRRTHSDHCVARAS